MLQANRFQCCGAAGRIPAAQENERVILLRQYGLDSSQAYAFVCSRNQYTFDIGLLVKPWKMGGDRVGSELSTKEKQFHGFERHLSSRSLSHGF